MELDPYLTPYTKIYSEWIRVINVRAEKNLLEENIGENLDNLG